MDIDSEFPPIDVERLPNGKWALVSRSVLDLNNPQFGVIGCCSVVDVFDDEAEALAAKDDWPLAVPA